MAAWLVLSVAVYAAVAAYVSYALAVAAAALEERGQQQQQPPTTTTAAATLPPAADAPVDQDGGGGGGGVDDAEMARKVATGKVILCGVVAAGFLRESEPHPTGLFKPTRVYARRFKHVP